MFIYEVSLLREKFEEIRKKETQFQNVEILINVLNTSNGSLKGDMVD